MRRNAAGLPNEMYLTNWPPTARSTRLTQIGISFGNLDIVTFTRHPNGISAPKLRGVVGATKSVSLGIFLQTYFTITIVLLAKWTSKNFFVISRCSTRQGTGWVCTIETAEPPSGSAVLRRWIVETLWTKRVTFRNRKKACVRSITKRRGFLLPIRTVPLIAISPTNLDDLKIANGTLKGCSTSILLLRFGFRFSAWQAVS